jgi:hypothetical protein
MKLKFIVLLAILIVTPMTVSLNAFAGGAPRTAVTQSHGRHQRHHRRHHRHHRRHHRAAILRDRDEQHSMASSGFERRQMGGSKAENERMAPKASLKADDIPQPRDTGPGKTGKLQRADGCAGKDGTARA